MTDAIPDIHRQKKRAALVSLAVKLVLLAGKLVAAALSGSLALASEAGNNLGDIATTLLSYYSIQAAARPADEDHQFGHGKMEAVSALVQTGFLFALAVFILIEAVKRLFAGSASIEAAPFAFAILVVSIIVDGARWLSLQKVAKATASSALRADALNFATDIVASILALAGLIAARYGLGSGDALAALGVALFIAAGGYRLGRDTIDTLVDAAPKGMSEPIRRLIGRVPGVIGVASLRLRPIGADIAGEAVVHVARTLSFERVAAITDAIAAELASGAPGSQIAVTVEPVALNEETIVDRILLIANRRHIPVHHVTVQTLDDKQAVSFDVELDGRLPLGAAHEQVTALEREIAEELGEDCEIESHIEPMDISPLDGRDCDDPVRTDVASALVRRAETCTTVFAIHDVRVRETKAGLIVNYHCLVDPDLSVDAVHERVDELDRKVREDCPSIARIVGHAEPQRTPGRTLQRTSVW